MTWALAVLAALTVLLWPERQPLRDRMRLRDEMTARDHVTERDQVPVRDRGRAGVGTRSRPSRGAEDTTAATVDEVADALVLVALALRAGLDLTHALEEVAARACRPVGRDLATVVAAVRWGRPVAEAWTYADAVWRPAALAWSVAETTGAAPAALLADAAVRLREGQERDRERRAARAGVLLVLPLGLGFLPAFACTAVLPVVIALAVGVLDTSG